MKTQTFPDIFPDFSLEIPAVFLKFFYPADEVILVKSDETTYFDKWDFSPKNCRAKAGLFDFQEVTSF